VTAARLTLAVALLILSACASVVPQLDPPQVTLDSFRALPAQEGAPRFEILLRIANPNQQTLDIAGISYTVELLGAELVSGVTNEVPAIEGYTEEVVRIESSLKLFQLLKLLATLGREPGDSLDYRLLAKIDFRGLIPTQRLEEHGEITLR
jgi:LEA14-like dessication related protein